MSGDDSSQYETSEYDDSDDANDDTKELEESDNENETNFIDNLNLKDVSDDDNDGDGDDNDDNDDGDLSRNKYNNNDFDEDLSDYEKDSNEKTIVKNVIKPKMKSKNVAKIEKYEYDSSDEEDLRNTIGNVPIEWYNDYSHIGYDWDGNKISKPPKGDDVDEFLKKMDDPYYWRTVRDRLTGQNVVLTDNDVEVIERVNKGQFPDPNYDPYEPFIDFFTYEKMIHPVTNRPETKASFIPSLSEKRKVSKIVAAIKRNRLKPKQQKEKEKPFDFRYDLWEKEIEGRNKKFERYIPAPKLKLPGHEESYNPPPEYLFTQEEEDQWKQQEEDYRKINFIPQKYSCLRKVPQYPQFVKERFERCLDLYLCPRARKMRANVDPEDLIPQLPRPRDLQPFPSIRSIIYKGHEDAVKCISVEPNGQFFISGSDDCTVKIWEVLTGRCMRTIKFEDSVRTVSWCPDESKCLCAVVVGKDIFIINPCVGDKLIVNDTDLMFKPSLTSEDDSNTSSSSSDPTVVDWQIIDQEKGLNSEWKNGIRVIIKHRFVIKQITWHRGGDYFAVVMPEGANKSVVIHQLSKSRSQIPFKKSKGIIQCVLFHPLRPYFFVATKRNVRVYNLIKQELTKKLMANCNEISSIAVHPEGDNIIVGSYDLRLSWFDLDLSTKPYKTLHYHKKAIRDVTFHERYPLFASASDDGTVIVSHGMVYSDLLQNPLIVPVKILRDHVLGKNLGVSCCAFHPYQPWIFTGGADSTIRLYS